MLNIFSSIALQEKVISALVRLPQSLTANEASLGYFIITFSSLHHHRLADQVATTFQPYQIHSGSKVYISI